MYTPDEGLQNFCSFLAEKIDTTVAGGVPLTLYIPHCAVPELSVGAPEADKSEYILAAQAADIRADNREILGSFVLKGDVLAQGISKKGYCAIIDGRITIGVAENTDLFDKAVETEGYFFRQYPLVDNGLPVDNNLKSASVRKALCSKADEIFIAFSREEMTMQDYDAGFRRRSRRIRSGQRDLPRRKRLVLRLVYS